MQCTVTIRGRAQFDATCVKVAGYVEVHLEQGPVLEALGKPLGVVTSIAGQTRLSVSMTGTQVVYADTCTVCHSRECACT